MIDYTNYEVEKIIYESNYQRILLCRNDSGNLFYNNIILRTRLIELVDKENYPDISDNIISLEETEDRLYIFSKYTEDMQLTEYFNKNEISYKSRVELTEKLLLKFKEVEKYSDIQAESMITEDNLLIDSEENLKFKNLLIFNQDYDIEESKIMKNISNYIHIIFTGECIEDFHISENIPPDVRRIIKRANTNEYRNIEDLLDSFRKSPTYTLILPLGFRNNEIETNEIDSIDEEVESEEKQDKKPKKNSKYVIVTIIAIVVIPIIILLFQNRGTNMKSNNSNENTTNPPLSSEQNDSGEAENNNEEESLPETILEFFNEELIRTESDKYAEMDYSKYYDGYYSLKIEKEGQQEEKYLFAIVDLNSEDFNYLKNREVGISSRFISDKNLEGELIIELRKNDKISNITTEKLTLKPDTWIIKQKSLVLGESDEVKLFFRFKNPGKVWIDSIEIDVLK